MSDEAKIASVSETTPTESVLAAKTGDATETKDAEMTSNGNGVAATETEKESAATEVKGKLNEC